MGVKVSFTSHFCTQKNQKFGSNFNFLINIAVLRHTTIKKLNITFAIGIFFAKVRCNWPLLHIISINKFRKNILFHDNTANYELFKKKKAFCYNSLFALPTSKSSTPSVVYEKKTARREYEQFFIIY